MKYAFILFLLISCASDKPEGRTEAEVLFKEAQELMDAERFILATEKLNLIKTQHPYSFYATPAELMQADILFQQENYVEAAAAYLIFRDFHPRHEKIPYVIFRIGESYFNQIPDTIDRDLEPAVEAIKYYNEIVQKYPDSSYRQEATEKIAKSKTMLRQKDEYIADFYFKTEEFGAARYWYLDIIESHRDKKTLQHAMKRTIRASFKLKEWKNCLEYTEKFYQLIDKEGQKDLKSVIDTCIAEAKKMT
jgi:outer membrane protein assembly factor BamD